MVVFTIEQRASSRASKKRPMRNKKNRAKKKMSDDDGDHRCVWNIFELILPIRQYTFYLARKQNTHSRYIWHTRTHINIKSKTKKIYSRFQNSDIHTKNWFNILKFTEKKQEKNARERSHTNTFQLTVQDDLLLPRRSSSELSRNEKNRCFVLFVCMNSTRTALSSRLFRDD